MEVCLTKRKKENLKLLMNWIKVVQLFIEKLMNTSKNYRYTLVDSRQGVNLNTSELIEFA